MAWLPESFVHPLRVAVGGGHRLRPILASDIDLDYPAVMGAPLDEAETALVGCVYIDPSEADTTAPFDAVVSWWMVDEARHAGRGGARRPRAPLARRVEALLEGAPQPVVAGY